MDSLFLNVDDIIKKLHPWEQLDLKRLLGTVAIETGVPLKIDVGITQPIRDLAMKMGSPSVEIRTAMERIAQVSNAFSSAMFVQQSRSFYDALPTIADYSRTTIDARKRFLELADAGDQVLTDTEHEYAADAVASFLFAEFKSTPKDELPQVVTDALETVVHSTAFRGDLQNRMMSSAIMKERWRIVERGVTAHDDQDYLVSVPVLVPQFEGLLVDCLILKNLVEREGKKLYRIDPETRSRLTSKKKDGTEVELTASGLDELIATSKFRISDDLKRMANYVADTLCRERNDVLHGSDLHYDKQKRSVSLVILISIMVEAIAQTEVGPAS
jgi:hypothetical protein